MRLSTRSRYGLRAMLALAIQESPRPVMAREIAESQDLPITYLEQLMLTLRKAGLVTATRGAKGGYVLGRDPERISLAEIVEAMEGEFQIADCADVPSCATDPKACALKEVFDEANQAVRDVFARISLAELARRQKSKSLEMAQMYYI